MPTRVPGNWPKILAAAGVAYPFVVYAALDRLPGRVLLLAGLTVAFARLLLARGTPALAVWTAPLAAGAACLAVLAACNPPWGAKAYPVVMSLSACGAFTASLIRPPSLVERMARLTTPDLGPREVHYTRRVTAVWAVFLAGNAAVAAALGVWGTLAQWTLWNGLLSYLLAGALFGGELLTRRLARRRAALP